jgi:hypothetical protein
VIKVAGHHDVGAFVIEGARFLVDAALSLMVCAETIGTIVPDRGSTHEQIERTLVAGGILVLHARTLGLQYAGK